MQNETNLTERTPVYRCDHLRATIHNEMPSKIVYGKEYELLLCRDCYTAWTTHPDSVTVVFDLVGRVSVDHNYASRPEASRPEASRPEASNFTNQMMKANNVTMDEITAEVDRLRAAGWTQEDFTRAVRRLLFEVGK